MNGVTQVNPGVDVVDFFQKQILPELQDDAHASRPVVKSSALKYVSVFRNQFAREQTLQILPLVVKHLHSPVVVVHTFAAYTVERILVTKEETSPGVKVPKIGKNELSSILEPLFSGLFVIIDNIQQNENAYVMKCVMRSLATANETIMDVTQIVVDKLNATLIRTAKNPRNPSFNHYLFESIAVLVRSVCSKEPTAVDSFESMLFPPFTNILTQDVTEFTPYVFQILAQLLEFRPVERGLGDAYTGLFPALLNTQIWDQRGNIPALSRLMNAYIAKSANELSSQLTPILGVFQKLLALGATVGNAYEILNAATAFFPQENFETYLKTIFELVLTRLKNSKTPKKDHRYATDFFALFVGKYGPQVFVSRMDAAAGPGVCANVIQHVWAKRLIEDPPNQKGDAKLHAIGVAKLLCEYPTLFDNDKAVWGKLLVGIGGLLTSSTFTSTALDENDTVDRMAAAEYDSHFSKLNYATKNVTDPFAAIPNPVDYFVRSFHGVIQTRGMPMMSLVKELLQGDEKMMAGMQNLFSQTGLQLV